MKNLENQEKINLLETGEFIKSAVNPRRIENLSGTDEDLQNPDYVRLREQLDLMQEPLVNMGYRWAYLMSIKDNEIFFYVDSIPLEHPFHTTPGLVYEKPPAELFNVFTNNQAVIAGPYSDEYGNYISVFIPINDLETNKTVGVLGVDVESSLWEKRIQAKMYFPGSLIAAFLLIYLISFYYYLSQRRIKRRLAVQAENLAATAKQAKCLYEIFHFISEKNISFEDIFTKVVNTLPSGFRYEEKIIVALTAPYKKYTSGRADEIKKSIKGQINVHNTNYGQIEVGYNEEIKDDGEEIFLKGEQQMLDSIVDRLGKVIERLQAEEELVKNNFEAEQAQKAMINVLEDVEEEKEKTEKLAHDLEKFQLAVANASDHIVITDPDGRILYANKAVETITGFSNKEVLWEKAGCLKLWGGLMPKEFYEKMWRAIKQEKKVFKGEINNQRKGGEKYIAEANISPVVGENGNVTFFVGIERDITKIKAVDQAKTEFVSLASHQLRTPLSSINWYTEMLLAGDAGKINEEQKQYLEEIYHGNQRMVDLVNALLDVSRIELGTFMVEPELLDISIFAEEILKELSATINAKKQKIIKKYEKDVPQIKADPKLTRIVFQNLLSNAVKYTPEKGNISVAISKKGKDILIMVKDTGYGIPKSQQGQIYNKLFRADNVRAKDTEGTGLGLYIVKAIVDQAQGKIWFDSEENKGTAFYVSLPIKGMVKKAGTKALGS
ncbi:MAG: PAS domain-containing sensor histidine kinase [Patescibacteria group bacterium]